MQHYKHFIIIWIGQLLSSIGTGISAFALSVYVFHVTGAAAGYGLMILASFLPALVLKPLGGVFADRYNRRVMMTLGDLGSALGLMFIIIMLALGVHGLWFLYVGSVLSAVFVALQNPAYKASITDFVGKENYGKASGLMQLAESSKYLISPIIAGFLIAMLKLSSVLWIDVLTFVVAIVIVLLVRRHLPVSNKHKPQNTFIDEFKLGSKYLFADNLLISLLLIISLVSFFIGVLQALLGPMVLSFASAKVFGTSQTIMAFGMLFTSVFMGLFGRSGKKLPVLSLGLILAGIFFALLGVSSSIVIITIMGFLFFMALPLINTSLDVLVRKRVDNDVQGRVWALISLISQFGMVIALGVAGSLADHVFNPLLMHGGVLADSVGKIIGVGPGRGIALLFVVSGLCVVIFGVWVGRTRSLSGLDSVSSG